MQISESLSNNIPGGPAVTSAISGDFETFLKMLTTQIQNQDPLSPMDAESFASQLASFSMVEQQTLTNQNLSALINSAEGSDLDRFVGIVGRTVSHGGGTGFNGSDVYFQLEEPVSESVAQLEILNEQGNVVATLPLSLGQERIAWSGVDHNGALVDLGRYSAVVREGNNTELSDISVYSEAVVEEVRFKPSGAQFVLDDGTIISEAQISALRQ